jgi:anthranilate synthase component II
MLLMIDNYDSFTYNLVQYFQVLDQKVSVYTHDNISLANIAEMAPEGIIISPGPKSPEDAGISLDVIKTFYKNIPILGVCLGHQCLAYAFGAKIIQAHEIMHGKLSAVTHRQQGLFKNIPSPFNVTRYHSLMIDAATLPECFRIDAMADQTIMAISHRKYPLFGVQFHPEAILTEHGLTLLRQYCAIVNKRVQ